MPGSIFQETIADPTGRYADRPSAAVTDTSTGDFLKAIAPAVGEIKSGYRLQGLEEEAAPVRAEGEALAAEKKQLDDAYDVVAEGAINLRNQKSLSAQENILLDAFENQVAKLQRSKDLLGPRAVEAQTRLESMTREFIAANPGLQQEALIRTKSPTLTRLATSYLDVEAAKAKDLEVGAQKEGLVGPNRAYHLLNLRTYRVNQEVEKKTTYQKK